MSRSAGHLTAHHRLYPHREVLLEHIHQRHRPRSGQRLPRCPGQAPRRPAAGRHPDRSTAHRHGAPIAILLLVRAEDGSLALAGLLSALFGLAAAVGQPLLGRMVDRHGQTRILIGATGAPTTAFLLLPCVSPTRHLALAALAVVIAGLSTPPLAAGLRTLWPVLLPDSDQQRAALSMDFAT